MGTRCNVYVKRLDAIFGKFCLLVIAPLYSDEADEGATGACFDMRLRPGSGCWKSWGRWRIRFELRRLRGKDSQVLPLLVGLCPSRSTVVLSYA